MNEKDTAPVGEVPGPSDDSAVAKWWMAIDDKPQGPHTAAYIALILKVGQVQPTTLVCQVGKEEWCPLLESAELVAAVETQSPGSLPPALPAAPGALQRTAGGFFDRFTNPTLPRFANWICVYCILIVPALFALGFLLEIGGLNSAADLKPESPLIGHAVAYDVITFVADGALAVVLVLGGLMLRKLQRKGAMLVKVRTDAAPLFVGDRVAGHDILECDRNGRRCDPACQRGVYDRRRLHVAVVRAFAFGGLCKCSL